jgi:hypothetical protein
VDEQRAGQDRSSRRARARVDERRRVAAEAGDDLGHPPRRRPLRPSVHGRTSNWFRGTQDRHEGHISAGGVDKDVVFAEADEEVNDEIDAAYRTKYHRYPASYVDPTAGPEARAATLRLVPR